MLGKFKDIVTSGAALEGLKEVLTPGAAIEKANAWLQEFNEAVPTLKALGLSVSDMVHDGHSAEDPAPVGLAEPAQCCERRLRCQDAEALHGVWHGLSRPRHASVSYASSRERAEALRGAATWPAISIDRGITAVAAERNAEREQRRSGSQRILFVSVTSARCK